MKLLFFDIECCNGRDICEFGYVLTDENFYILEKEDITINPNGEFCLPSKTDDSGTTDDFRLSFPEVVYRKSPEFTAYHQRIRELTQDPGHFVVGYSIQNDIRFLSNACKGYRLPPFLFSFTDAQKLFGVYDESLRQISLEKAMEHFGLDSGKLTLHNSADDAEMTMMVFRKLCEAYGETPRGLAERFRFCTGKTSNFRSYFFALQEEYQWVLDRISEGKRITRHTEDLITGSAKVSPRSYAVDTALKGVVVCVSQRYEQQFPRRTLALIELIFRHGGRFTRSVLKSNLFIRDDQLDENGKPLPCERLKAAYNMRRNRKRYMRIETPEHFLARFSLTVEDLSALPLPSASVFFDDAGNEK